MRIITLTEIHRILDNTNAHESVADVYTRFTNLEASKKEWGEDNQGRSHYYAIITNKLIKEGNEVCLNEVFEETNKISNFEELLEKLKDNCEVSYTYLINSY